MNIGMTGATHHERLPSVVEDFQDRFGTLHYASLPVGKSSDLSPFAV